MDSIHECMRRPVISIESQASAQKAAELMKEKKISALLAKKGTDYVGIITKTDLVNKLVAKGLDPKKTSVFDLMSNEIYRMDEYLSRGEANQFMSQHSIKHLAITSQGKIVGIVTVKDLVA